MTLFQGAGNSTICSIWWFRQHRLVKLVNEEIFWSLLGFKIQKRQRYCGYCFFFCPLGRWFYFISKHYWSL